MAKNAKNSAKKEARKASRALAGRTLAHPKSRVKDKKLAASILSYEATKKQKKKKGK
jgi:hypothetical protein